MSASISAGASWAVRPIRSSRLSVVRRSRGLLHVVAERASAAFPVEGAGADAAGEDRRLARAGVEAPHQPVVASLGMAAHAGQLAVDAEARVARGEEGAAARRRGREPLGA